MQDAFQREAPHAGEARTTADQPLPVPSPSKSQPITPQIRWESADFLVVDKPPHLEVHPSKPGSAWTLWDGLRELLSYEIVNGGQVSIINRLDRETSGLTLVAKTLLGARELSRQMSTRQIDKEYTAIVHGWPELDDWEVNAPMLRLGAVQPYRVWLKQGVHPEGAEARTRFRVECRFERETAPKGRFTVLRAYPETGRTHQIRVHAAQSGCALVGDKIYGADEGHYLEFIQTGWTTALQERLLLDRHALHCTRLGLKVSGQIWTSSLPADLHEFTDDRPIKKVSQARDQQDSRG